MNFNLASPEELSLELVQRLKAVRLSKGWQQQELAVRAGVSLGTIKSLEKTGQSTVLSLLRVVQALGLQADLQQAFIVPVHSIAAMERAEQVRLRAPRKPRPPRQPHPALS